MRLTLFYDLIDEEFGTIRGRSLLVDHVSARLAGRTAAEALEAGVEPREVWRALCADFDVPRSRW